MRLGLISDIHGNEIALDAVVRDGMRNGVDAWWVLGDLVAIGPDPVETLDLLRSLPHVRFVSGNTDRYVVSGDRPFPHAEDVERDPTLRELFDVVEASFSWTRSQLSEEQLQWLAMLPSDQRVELPDGTRLLGVHASPQSDDGPGITPEIEPAHLEASIGNTKADVICGGHTHRPTDRTIGNVRAVNLGSVSNPITSDLRATYVIVHAERRRHTVEHRRVVYDHEAVVRRVERSTHPDAPYLASFQRGEHVRFPADGTGTPAFAT